MAGPLTVSRLRELLHYDPQTGIFRWRVARRPNIKAGDEAGWLHKDGCRMIGIDQREYKAHRLAWFYMTGHWPVEIDHRNGARGDNCFENLRELPHALNLQNQRRAKSTNRTGLLGVTLFNGTFRAQIMLNGKNIYLGCYPTAEAAHRAYVVAKRRVHPAGLL